MGDLGGEEEEVLLAEPPGKRKDDQTPSYRRPNKYKMKKGAGSPARKKRHSQIHSPTKEYGNTARSRTPGMTAAATPKTNPLAYGRVTEEKSFEDLEEQKLFNIDSDVRGLIESLFKKEKEHETQ